MGARVGAKGLADVALAFKREVSCMLHRRQLLTCFINPLPVTRYHVAMNLLKKVLQRGLLDTVQTIFNRVVPASVCRWSCGVIYELDAEFISRKSASKTDTDSEFKWRLLRVETSEAVEHLREVTHNSAPLAYSSNDVGYAVIAPKSNETVGGFWAAVDAFMEADLGFELRFANDQAWIYCAHISKAHRGKGAYRKLLAYAVADLTAQDRQALFAMVEPWNLASTRIHSQLSKRIVGRVKVVRLLSRVWLQTSGQLSTNKSWFNSQGDGPATITWTQDQAKSS